MAKKNYYKFIINFAAKQGMIAKTYKNYNKVRFLNRVPKLLKIYGSQAIFRVSYGMGITNKGKLEEFDNAAEISSISEIKHYMDYFCDPALLKYVSDSNKSAIEGQS